MKINLKELKEIVKQVMLESEDWGDSDKISRAADFEREGKVELYYITDYKGKVWNIWKNPDKAQEWFNKNFTKLGLDKINVVVVPLEDYNSERVNAGNIKDYARRNR